MSPQRIQLRRTKGWRKPEGTIVVSRPSRWGNEFTIYPDALTGRWWAEDYVDDLERMRRDTYATVVEARRVAAAAYFRVVLAGNGLWGIPTIAEVRGRLAGRDLACWCPLDQPCHADVLLELANGGA